MKLKDICQLSKGKKPVRLRSDKSDELSIPYINIKAFEKGLISEYTDGKKCNLCNDDDLLMVWDGARCGLIGKAKKGAVGSTLMKILPKVNIEKEYLYHFLSSKFHILNTKPKGVGIPHIEPTLLLNFELLLPPLAEQQAIVAKIEELLSDLENGKQQLLIAQQQLKLYRQSLLKAAFEGKLTNKNVKDGELPEGWIWCLSGMLFDSVTSGSRGWAKYYSMKGAIFLRITNMNFDTLSLDLQSSKIQYVSPPLNTEGVRTKVKEGDFLFSITGYLGMFAIAPNLENAFVNQHIALCRPKNGFIKKYVGYWIISKTGGLHYLNKSKKGAVKAGLNLDDLKNFPVPISSVQEQIRIVEILDNKLTVCDKIEETITKSLQQAETLRQSILKKAFEGKLVSFG
ncbi:MAG: restriction endonuclease subunit S [Ignavibacteriales bacterium]|nr:restriction endonuclease subunit S [Ignavibacteriales bacterium]